MVVKFLSSLIQMVFAGGVTAEESRMKVQAGKQKIRRQINKCRGQAEAYYKTAHRAFRLNDQEQFNQCARMYGDANRTINRLERFLLKIEVLELRRDEITVAADFVEAMKGMCDVIMREANPKQLAKLQEGMSTALSTANLHQQRMDDFLETATSIEMEETRQWQESAQITTESEVWDSAPAGSITHGNDEAFRAAIQKFATRIPA